MSDWIRCSERLPEYSSGFSREVLAYIGDPQIWDCMEIVRLHDACTGGPPMHWRSRRNDEYSLGWFRWWMPLPEPPKE